MTTAFLKLPYFLSLTIVCIICFKATSQNCDFIDERLDPETGRIERSFSYIIENEDKRSAVLYARRDSSSFTLDFDILEFYVHNAVHVEHSIERRRHSLDIDVAESGGRILSAIEQHYISIKDLDPNTNELSIETQPSYKATLNDIAFIANAAIVAFRINSAGTRSDGSSQNDLLFELDERSSSDLQEYFKCLIDDILMDQSDNLSGETNGNALDPAYGLFISTYNYRDGVVTKLGVEYQGIIVKEDIEELHLMFSDGESISFKKTDLRAIERGQPIESAEQSDDDSDVDDQKGNAKWRTHKAQYRGGAHINLAGGVFVLENETWSGQVSGGYMFTDVFGLEVQGRYTKFEHKYYNMTYEFERIYYGMNILLTPSKFRFRPFLKLGAMHSTIIGEEPNFEIGYRYFVGAGLEFKFSNYVGWFIGIDEEFATHEDPFIPDDDLQFLYLGIKIGRW